MTPSRLADRSPLREFVPENWDPRADRDFRERWISHLREHPRQYWHPTDLWAPQDTDQGRTLSLEASAAVNQARTAGDVIIGDSERGYAYFPGDDNRPTKQSYIERAAELLLENRGKWVDLRALLGGSQSATYHAVAALREFGWIIKGRKGGLDAKGGYKFVGWSKPPSWLRKEAACWRHVPAFVLYVRRRRFREPISDQLQLELN